MRLVATRANAQPAFGCYRSVPETNVAHAFSLFVLTLEGDHISAITWFADSSVFPQFGLPQTLP
jgi:RNA polymerase sigma-70 factor (ECF subfamily)